METVNVVWFRNGLRFHDNGSLLNATKDTEASLLLLFIWDGETPVTKKCMYNKAQFLLECLEDLEDQLRNVGSRLHFISGNPVDVFRKLSKQVNIQKLCFDQDCEPIWLKRDNDVKEFCISQQIEVCENVGATLWNPLDVIEANGVTPPLTYTMFTYVTQGLGDPDRPVPDINLAELNYCQLSEHILGDMGVHLKIPTPEDLGFVHNGEKKVYQGGERKALKHFNRRVEIEKEAFLDGSFLPNRRDPDILCPPKSLSPDLKFGCLSVKTFYWAIYDAFHQINEGSPPASYNIVSQLIWREFFYMMSTNNPFYAEMKRNLICINIPWSENQEHLALFNDGRTGYPFIDAGIRQLKKEGWIHHVVRNALSMFLTRGDLWLSWEHGLDLFLNYLIDADWSVCAGNWMWVSSSAFEKALNCSFSVDPRVYGKRIDPDGDYVKKYIPELAEMPTEYVYAPWTAPLEVQEEANCVIGKDYPQPMVDHDTASAYNRKMMLELQKSLLLKFKEPPKHIKPSNEEEIRNFFRIGIPPSIVDSQ